MNRSRLTKKEQSGNRNLPLYNVQSRNPTAPPPALHCLLMALGRTKKRAGSCLIAAHPPGCARRQAGRVCPRFSPQGVRPRPDSTVGRLHVIAPKGRAVRRIALTGILPSSDAFPVPRQAGIFRRRSANQESQAAKPKTLLDGESARRKRLQERVPEHAHPPLPARISPRGLTLAAQLYHSGTASWKEHVFGAAHCFMVHVGV